MNNTANEKSTFRRRSGLRMLAMISVMASFMLLDTPKSIAQSDSSGTLEETLQRQMQPFLPHLSEEAAGEWAAISLNESTDERLKKMKLFIQRIRNPESCWDSEHHRVAKPLVQGVCEGVSDFQTSSHSSAVAQVRNALQRIPGFLSGLRSIEQRIQSRLAAAASEANADHQRPDLAAIMERREREARANSAASIARETRAMEREARRSVRESQRLDRRDRCLSQLHIQVPHYRREMGNNEDVQALSRALRQVRSEVLQRRLEAIISGEARANASTPHGFQAATEPAYLASALSRGRVNNNIAIELVVFSQDYLDSSDYGTDHAKQGREELQALLNTLKKFHPVMTPAEHNAVRRCMAGGSVNTRRMRAQRQQERQQADEQILRGIDGDVPDNLNDDLPNRRGSAAE